MKRYSVKITYPLEIYSCEKLIASYETTETRTIKIRKGQTLQEVFNRTFPTGYTQKTINFINE